MIFIPELQLYSLINTLIEYVRQDLSRYKANPQRTLLYRIFGELNYDKFHFFSQGSAILNKNDKRRLEINIGYNLQRAASPTIHIIIPANDQGQSNGVGFDLGYTEKVVLDGGDKSRETYSRSFQGSYNLLLTSENMGEIIFLHTLLQSLVIGCHSQFELQGFQNLKIRSQDITLQQDLMPAFIYHRILDLQFNYDFISPSIEEDFELTMKDFTFTDVMVQNIVAS